MQIYPQKTTLCKDTTPIWLRFGCGTNKLDEVKHKQWTGISRMHYHNGGDIWGSTNWFCYNACSWWCKHGFFNNKTKTFQSIFEAPQDQDLGIDDFITSHYVLAWRQRTRTEILLLIAVVRMSVLLLSSHTKHNLTYNMAACAYWSYHCTLVCESTCLNAASWYSHGLAIHADCLLPRC